MTTHEPDCGCTDCRPRYCSECCSPILNGQMFEFTRGEPKHSFQHGCANAVNNHAVSSLQGELKRISSRLSALEEMVRPSKVHGEVWGLPVKKEGE